MMQHALNFSFARPELERWLELARSTPLAILLDIDGTLIDFAPTPEQAHLDPDAVRTLRQLVASGVSVTMVSGRARVNLDPFVELVPGARWIAEHGAWHRLDAEWVGPPHVVSELDDLVATLDVLANAAGARIERKSCSFCLHWRPVPLAQRRSLIAAAELACDEWLEARPDYERIAGIELVEVRRRATHKGLAVQWTRDRIDDVRIIAIGDDVTDEDMFAALGDRDASIAVGDHHKQTRAQTRLAGPAAVRSFLHWIIDARAGVAVSAPQLPLSRHVPPRDRRDLVVISNRTPTQVQGRRREVGGLVAALEPAIQDRRGIWLGWSGVERDDTSSLCIDTVARPARASFDLSPNWRENFYAGFCNRVLWPLFHGFSDRVRYRDEEWQAYVEANAAYAMHATELAERDGTIWVHDYHLFLIAKTLRRLGHRGKIGLFLHIPFPSRDLFQTIPWRRELLEGLLDFDLLGFHTQEWADNFVAVARDAPGVTVRGTRLVHAKRSTAVGVFPITIDPSVFSVQLDESPDVAGLRAALGARRLLLGVDRLDHTKGIPERLEAFERLLEQYPRWRGGVSFVQVSVPSRADIPEYAELRHRVEKLVGQINGRFGEADWVPVRYLYRSYDQLVLAQLYRLADVALVTPLRDGMNLVAKEFVVAQDRTAPGVLILSRFAGAAVELDDAILTNPFHRDGMAADIDRALDMPAELRVERHDRLLEKIRRGGTPHTWASSFLDTLRTREPGHVGTEPVVTSCDDECVS
jgi:trehalose 6-phosphate synthase